MSDHTHIAQNLSAYLYTRRTGHHSNQRQRAFALLRTILTGGAEFAPWVDWLDELATVPVNTDRWRKALSCQPTQPHAVVWLLLSWTEQCLSDDEIARRWADNAAVTRRADAGSV